MNTFKLLRERLEAWVPPPALLLALKLILQMRSAVRVGVGQDIISVVYLAV